MSENLWCYPATVVRVLDGDTVVFKLTREVSLDFGFRMIVKTSMSFEGSFRLVGLNAPEIHSKNKNEVAAGLVARQALINLLTSGTLVVESQKPSGPIEKDFYGRWLCLIKVTLPSGEVLDVAAKLISLGVVVPYDGKHARLPWVDPGTSKEEHNG